MKNNTNENKINGTSPGVFSKYPVRFIKDDLNEIINKLYELEQKVEGKELQDELRWRAEDVEDILEEIEEMEDKTDALIKSIAS